MRLNCTVTKANPNNINFTWHFCDLGRLPRGSNCKMWKQWSRDYSSNRYKSSLQVLNQTSETMLYRCSAKNAVGMGKVFWEVIFLQGNV